MNIFCDTYTVVDVETTGLDPKKDKITEIGAIRIENGQKIAEFHSLVNPGRKLDERIVELTGLTDEKLKQAPFITEVIKDFLSFETTGCLMGHSVLFDYSFLKRAAVNAGESFEKTGIDTLAIARKYLQDLESRALPYLCRHFQIEHKAHRALSDVEATWSLYGVLKERFGKDEEAAKVFSKHPLIYQVKKESPATKKQLEQLKRFLNHYHIESEYNIESLSRNEASRYMDQLISRYGRIPPRNV
ncbi:MAG: 3'-5' exonuclease [Lachnospiraceae bacterium]|nr:3'-5' exonuclease [Lachnospiraceae bacterium]